MTIHARPIRMSGAGHCPRRQAYSALSIQITNPPDTTARNRMALGDAAEILIINELIHHGWSVHHTQATPGGSQLEIIRHDPPLSGHPDGVCQHPVHTDGLRITLEAKSMSPELLDRVVDEGIPQVYPDYMDQAAIYAHHLHCHNLVDDPQRAIFAVMDREGRPGPIQDISWPPSHVPDALSRLTNTWQYIQRGQLPPRPYLADDPHCRHCPFRNDCHGVAKREDRQHGIRDVPEAAAAGQRWLEATTQRQLARDELARHCPDFGHTPIRAGPVIASWFIPNQEPLYDTRYLATLLTPQQLKDARLPDEPTQAFWVRVDRNYQPDPHQGGPTMDATGAAVNEQANASPPDEPPDLAYQVCSEMLSEAHTILDACESEPDPWAARYRFDALKPIVAEIGRQIEQLQDQTERDTCRQLYQTVTQKGSRIAPTIQMICANCDEPFTPPEDNPRATTCARNGCAQH